VLAKQRLAIKRLGRFILETDDGRQMLAAIVGHYDGIALCEVRIGDRLGERVDRTVADIELGEPFHPMR